MSPTGRALLSLLSWIALLGVASPGCGRTDIYFNNSTGTPPASTDPEDTETEDTDPPDTDSETEPAPLPGVFRSQWSGWVVGTGEIPMICGYPPYDEIPLGSEEPQLYAMSGTGIGHVHAVGECRLENTPKRSACILRHSDTEAPHEWEISMQQQEADTVFLATWSLSLTDTYAVGTGTVYHSNGMNWTPVILPAPFSEWPEFTAVRGTVVNNWVVGGAHGPCADDPEELCGGLILWDGTVWSSLAPPGIDWDVVGVPTALSFVVDTLFVTTRRGQLLTVYPTYAEMESIHNGPLESLLVMSGGNIWVAGSAGFVAHRTEGGWTEAHLGDTFHFYSIAYESSELRVAGGVTDGEDSAPVILRFYSGSGWSQVYPD